MFISRRWRFATIISLSLCSLLTGISAYADGNNSGPVYADSHAPIGVMGDHMHKKGEFMFSYRRMSMSMQDNRIGTDKVSDQQVLQVPNRFFGVPMQPPNLRIVPQEMDMTMHMLGVMWAPTDWVTTMLMLNYLDKDMDLTTYNPPGDAVVGDFTTSTSGLGDTYVGGMFRLLNTGKQKLHFNLGVMIPTGDVEETGNVLTPMNAVMNTRLPYAMQLGSGTWDIKPGLTYTGRAGSFTWGAQYMGTFRTGSNNGYTWGDRQQLTGWGAYSPRPWLSFSARLAWDKLDDISGIDPAIVGPIQTANPDYYGGTSTTGLLGFNLAGQSGWIRNQRLALEYGIPIEQDLNGPQMSLDDTLTLGWQYSFKGY